MLADTNDRINVELNDDEFNGIPREAITYEAILAAKDNPEYQAALVRHSSITSWPSSSIFLNCGDDPELQEQIAMFVAAGDLFLDTSKDMLRKAQEKSKTNSRLPLLVIGASKKPSCCIFCKTGWRATTFPAHTPERILAEFVISGIFSLDALCLFLYAVFQKLYILRARNSVIAAYIEAMRQRRNEICPEALEIAERKARYHAIIQKSAQASRETSQREPYDPGTVYDPRVYDPHDDKIKCDSRRGYNSIDAQNVEDPAEPLVNGNRNLATHNF
jgi:hypothetical protein